MSTKNELKFTGIVTAISAKQSGESANGKHWEKQNFVVTEQKDKYPQALLVEAFNKSEIIENLQEGDEVEVSFNVSSKEYKGAFYGSNQLRKVDILSKAQKPIGKTDIYNVLVAGGYLPTASATKH